MPSSFPLSDISSLWQETATLPPDFDSLARDETYDIAIIGGGYTGLSTARALGARGLSSVVLEANRIGWGASGRNGGVVSAKFRLSFAGIAAQHGIDVARRMHIIAVQGVENIDEIISDYDIKQAHYQPAGSLRLAHNKLALAALQQEADWLRQVLGDNSCTLLSADEVKDEVGTDGFVGGLLNERGGTIHPLNFVFGLARGLQARGITLYQATPVTHIRYEGAGVRLETPTGSIAAKQLVIATNGYSHLTRAMPKIAKSIIPFRSAMIATEPLPNHLKTSPLRQGRSYTETRRMMRWFRKVGDRMLYGGRGAFGKSDSKSAYNTLATAMRRQFPQLENVAITHQWSGLVAMTMDSLPHLGRFDDRIVYAAGYNGSGVALASSIGQHVAALIVGEAPDLGLLTSRDLKSVPLYSIREPAIRLVAGWYQFLDAIGR